MNWKAVLDRIEGEFGVLLCSEEEFEVTVPLQLLPANIAEGDYLAVQLQIDHQSTEAAKERVTRLIDKLVNRSQED